MNRSKRLPKKSQGENFQLHALIQERSKAELLAVQEMSKHPLSPEQMRAQITRNHALADKLEKRNSRTTHR